jgi:formylglycine-generating enzyme required for sulfatase activity
MKTFILNIKNLKRKKLNNITKNETNKRKSKEVKRNSFNHFILHLFLGFLIPNIVNANGVVISNVTLGPQNTTNHYTMINFDISWQNSWKITTGEPYNWDACWVFAKYRKKTTYDWKHCTLNWVAGTGAADGHIVPGNATIRSSNDNGAGGAYGVFIYYNTDMSQGPVSYTGVGLRWNYGVDGLFDNDSVEICVFAIEMVYVPQGSFYLGDGTTTNIAGQFEAANSGGGGYSGQPFLVTSENAITLGGGGAGSLGNHNTSGMWTADDFNNSPSSSKTLPAAFPKGYKAFYCMKYEITQEQYVEFLNKLTYNQQNTRTGVAPNSAAGTAVLGGGAYRNRIEIMTPGIGTYKPAVYASELNNNGTYNDATDGQNIACNYLSWADVAAYLDWAALRPMTELEYEKACRGPSIYSPTNDEFAWGTTFLTQATGITNPGQNNETASNAGANINTASHPNVPGTMRVGNFGQSVNTRQATGATYYGIMEMSGNALERVVSVGNSTGRAFTDVNGDGVLNATGDANQPTWPGTGATGAGFRGGGWNSNFTDCRISDRIYASATNNSRYASYGGRGVRTAP